MGKALVIDGLTVSNPLCVVTFTTEVESLTINKNSLSLTVGDTGTITATVVTSDGTTLNPTFTSSDSTIASVSASGNTATITAVAAGSATITVKAGSKTVTCNASVSAAPADELSAYYAANQTITQADQTALNALVTGMTTAGLWAKVKRFYPMLGTSLSDLLLEIKDNSGKGLSDLSSTLTASTNAITTSASGSNMSGSSEDSMLIAANNVSFISLTDLTNAANDVQTYSAKFADASSHYMTFSSSAGSYKKLSVAIKTETTSTHSYPSDNSIQSIVDRSAIVSVNGTAADYYVNGTKIGSLTIEDVGSLYLNVPYKFLYNGTGAVHKLLMITSALTESEALALSGLLDTFYVATGKRSASS